MNAEHQDHESIRSIHRRGVRLELLLVANATISVILIVLVSRQYTVAAQQLELVEEATKAMIATVHEASSAPANSRVELRGGDQSVVIGDDRMARLGRLGEWTTEQAAEYLGVNQDTIRRRLSDGDLTGNKDESGRWKIDNPEAPTGVH